MAELDDDILEALKNDGIGAGHTVKFTHDIFFEWSFLHLLISREDEWLSEIRAAGEQPVLGRVVELLSQSVFIADLNWESHLARIESANMRPQWARAWLIGPFTFPRERQSFHQTGAQHFSPVVSATRTLSLLV